MVFRIRLYFNMEVNAGLASHEVWQTWQGRMNHVTFLARSRDVTVEGVGVSLARSGVPLCAGVSTQEIP